MSATPTFYMNYAEGQRAPTVRYATYELAKTEAKRLAKVLGVEVFTLQAVSAVKLSEFVERHFNTKDDLPF